MLCKIYVHEFIVQKLDGKNVRKSDENAVKRHFLFGMKFA